MTIERDIESPLPAATEVGMMAKRILDLGRVAWLREAGWAACFFFSQKGVVFGSQGE